MYLLYAAPGLYIRLDACEGQSDWRPDMGTVGLCGRGNDVLKAASCKRLTNTRAACEGAVKLPARDVEFTCEPYGAYALVTVVMINQNQAALS